MIFDSVKSGKFKRNFKYKSLWICIPTGTQITFTYLSFRVLPEPNRTDRKEVMTVSFFRTLI
jgi:hypothetical protein